ncbi:MAG: SPOR domain-containing protein [Bacteroidetes bacterium]|nr:SPOR domain-containing protein [Bacteroidota bacterium]
MLKPCGEVLQTVSKFVIGLRKVEAKKLTTFQLLVHYLHAHSHCAIAGLGEFQLLENPAHPDPNQHVFKPFQLLPIWKGMVQKTDPNFLIFCSGIWNCSTTEAETRIAFEVNQAFIYIGLHKKLLVNGLGTFSLDSSSSLQFEADLNQWVSAWSFGLKEVRFQPAAEQTRKLVVDRTQSPSDLEEPNLVREKALLELREMLDKAQVAQKTQGKKGGIQLFPFIATVLTLLLVANVVYFLRKNPVHADTTQQKAPTPESVANMVPVDNLVEGTTGSDSSNPSELVDSKHSNQTPQVFQNPGSFIRKPADFVLDSSSYGQPIDPNILASIDLSQEINPKPAVVEDEASELEEPEDQKASSVKENNLPALSAPTKPIVDKQAAEPVRVGGYGLVAGAFKSRENAEKLKAELKRNGFPEAEIVNPSSHKYLLVLYKRFDSRMDAEKFQSGKSGDLAKAWIFEGK